MLFHLFYPLRAEFAFFNVFRYPSFRVIAAAVMAFFIVYYLIPWFIRWMRAAGVGQPIRDDGPESHLAKQGTPTMGGVIILCAVIVPALLLCNLKNYYVWTVTVVMVCFGLVGLADDLAKVRARNSKGVPGRLRLLLEFGIAGIALAVITMFYRFSTNFSLPFIKTQIFNPDLGVVYVGLGMLVIVGTANAVNLTDGLDGLAIGPSIVSSGTFLILAYGTGTVIAGFNIAEYLKIPHVPGVEELAVVCGALLGAGIGFLWYNANPAEIFMGDVGSLSIGGALGTMAVLTKMEILSMLINGLFLMETVSVIVQSGVYKYYRRTKGKEYADTHRVFRMAPIHHHFERVWAEDLGRPPKEVEPKVIVRLWLVAGLLSLAALGTLKLR
ncbi:MAG: phospho-N-acetylmuramoyl-pentapeptide-transferase [Deltaproteobacteria bacterium]|nr:phospho-N-acetylmuramoyl-pentapeptide-transferase [Deltaproteobacteria bacterium]